MYVYVTFQVFTVHEHTSLFINELNASSQKHSSNKLTRCHIVKIYRYVVLLKFMSLLLHCTKQT